MSGKAMRILFLALIILPLSAFAQVVADVEFSCTYPDTRADGTPMAQSEIQEVVVNLQKGSATRTGTIPATGVCSYLFEALEAGEWAAQAVLVDTDGLVSLPSNAITFTISDYPSTVNDGSLRQVNIDGGLRCPEETALAFVDIRCRAN